MKHSLWIGFLLTLLVVGCSQENEMENQSADFEGKIFTASFESGQSRTYLKNGRLSLWTANDRISLFNGNTLNCHYCFDGDTGDDSGMFFMMDKPDGTGHVLSANYAVYPYDADMEISTTGVVKATWRANQSYAPNSYGLGDNLMVAVTSDTDDTFLYFKSVGGCFKLQLYGEDVAVKSITLTGNDGEKIAGEANVTVVYDQGPTVSMTDAATTSITLDCGNGITLGATTESATAFWFVLPPVTFSKGVTVTVTDVEGRSFTQSTSKELVIKRNVVKPMVAVEVDVEKGLGEFLDYDYDPDMPYGDDEEEWF